jgi:LacI family transcriptional regulator
MGKRNEVTIYDIAGALNLSASTISRALNDSESVREQTRSRIKRVASELGYQRSYLDAGLRSPKSNVLAAMVTHLNTTVASNVLAGAESAATQAGYSLTLHQSMNRPEIRANNLENIRKRNVDGVLVTSTYFQEYAFLDQLATLNVPSVVVETSSFLPSRPKKQITDYQNAYELTNHLVERGCRRIVYVSSDLEQTRHENLLAGYQKALQQSKLAEAEQYVRQSQDVRDSWLDISELFLRRSSRPDGIIFCSNVIAASAFASQENSMNRDVFWITCRKGNISSQSSRLIELGKLAASLLICLGKQTTRGILHTR